MAKRKHHDQPAPFPLIEDARPASERKASERYLEPTLFSGDQPPAPRRYYIEYECGGYWCPWVSCAGSDTAGTILTTMRTRRADVTWRARED